MVRVHHHTIFLNDYRDPLPLSSARLTIPSISYGISKKVMVSASLQFSNNPFIKKNTFGFNTNKVESLGGVDVPKEKQKSILESLGFIVSEKNNIFNLTVPSFRPDIEGEADIVEEILRIYGFDQIPLTNISDHKNKKTVLSSELK